MRKEIMYKKVESVSRENMREAIRLAEKMHARLNEKRRNPQPLTPEEELAKKEWLKKKTPREECKHLKGAVASRWGVDVYGGPPINLPAKDYNLAFFTFVSGKSKIWCLNNCGFVSHSGDPNWKEAVAMFNLSSNTRASSEFWPSKT
jgi:hypothetical protein